MSSATLRFASMVLGLCIVLAAPLRAQPIDQWHYIDRDSVLHTDLVEGLHGAGVIQADQIFALLYLGLPGENGVVSVVLPTPNAAETLTSVLVKSNGRRFTRVVSSEELDTSRVNDTDHAYSFPITDADVDLFKGALRWEISTDAGNWTVTLRGSRRAIETAERALKQRIADLSRPAVPVSE